MKETSLKSIIALGVSVVLAWSFILLGWAKIYPTQEIESKFMVYHPETFGYAPGFAMIVGIAEILGGLLGLIPRVSFIGAGILIVIMAGAIYTHLSTSIGSPFFAIILLVLAVSLLYLRWPWRHKQKTTVVSEIN